MTSHSTVILSILVCLMVSGCFPIDTTRVYNKSMTSGVSHSENIYLSFKDNKHASFYFLLERNLSSDQYILKVRWINSTRELHSKGMETSLRFLVDKEEIIRLMPCKPPKIASYRIDEGGIEEEICYCMTKNQLEEIANAKTASVELSGRYLFVVGILNKRHSFRAMKDFLHNG